MKKYVLLLAAFIAVLIFTSCSESLKTETETDADINASVTGENGSDAFSLLPEKNESSSLSSDSDKLSLEDVTSEYVAPDFVMPYNFDDCFDYLKAESSEILEKTENENGDIAEITLKTADGTVKAKSVFTYGEENKCVTEYSYSDDKTEKFSFIYYPSGNISSASHSDPEGAIEVYLFNEDGSSNGYINSEGISSLILGAVMQGLGGTLS